MLIKIMTGTAFAAVLLAGAASAGSAHAQSQTDAQDPGHRAESPEVVERGPNGQATKVRVNGVVYPVCTRDDEDSCIQPRAARLGWGDRPLETWPGEPASRMQDTADRSGT
ncbi:hypothetical protein [Brevundimonas sp. A19_0]|uniref:hypothetical protein n=1 Tax=Brevundimonas sp. A19_0 TaxID=2821087 RepID=UPI001ADB43C6|nr:hypothetical protein [Brevundimonas sp. A19_0]MBO9500963.1 hypothetical protein [Brevundimonas sp. A19_0]